MRADRLVALMLLLRQHGRLSAAALARELEVSTRTVLRDVEALSTAGVPIYAERGRHGGFSLLPGFQTELSALSQDEALALVIAGSRRGARAFGMGNSLTSAMRKVIDALPDSSVATANEAVRRLLVDPDTDLLDRPVFAEEVPQDMMDVVRSAVFAGRKLRILYAPAGKDPSWRTVDPVGLVTVRDQGYLLATRSGEDRAYRLTRLTSAAALPEAAERAASVDLAQVWQDHGARLRGEGEEGLTATLRVASAQRLRVGNLVRSIEYEGADIDGWVEFRVTFQDQRHAEWALWKLEKAAEVVEPRSLGEALRDRAQAFAAWHDLSRPSP